MAGALGELVPKTQPLLLNQDLNIKKNAERNSFEVENWSNLESLQSSVVRVQQHHCQCRQLGSPVPTIAAVHHHRGLVVFHLQIDMVKGGKNWARKEVTLSAIFTAPAKIILTWLSQPVASRLLNPRASSITGKHMSFTYKRHFQAT